MKIVIPAIDIREGRVVRLIQGDYLKQTTYSDDPVAILGHFIEAGALWVHIINLDGALTGDYRNNVSYSKILNLLNLSKKAGIKIQIGGGIRSVDVVEELLIQGAERIILGTIAFEDNNLLEDLSN